MFKIYIYIGLKKKRLVWVFLEIEEIRDKANETSLKKGGGIEMSTTVALPYTQCALSFAFVILTIIANIDYRRCRW